MAKKNIKNKTKSSSQKNRKSKTVTQSSKSSTAPVAVVGMHRSGTSMVMRILNHYGVYIGEEEQIMSAKDDNVHGFFENEEFVAINEALLTHFKGEWDDPPKLDEGWQYSPDIQEIVDRAKQLIKALQGKSSVWGWKDPRTSLLIPFWTMLLPDLKFVICLRNPLQVAQSLAKRNGIPPRQASGLWFHYQMQAMRDTKNYKRLLVDYDSFLENPQQWGERLLQFCDLHYASDEEALDSLVENSLYHHRESTLDLLRTSSIPPLYRLYYLGLSQHILDEKQSLPGAQKRSITLNKTSQSKTIKNFHALIEEFQRDNHFALVEHENNLHQQRISKLEERVRNLQNLLMENEKGLARQTAITEKYYTEVNYLKDELTRLHQIILEKNNQLTEHISLINAFRERIESSVGQLKGYPETLRQLLLSDEMKQQILQLVQQHQAEFSGTAVTIQNLLPEIKEQLKGYPEALRQLLLSDEVKHQILQLVQQHQAEFSQIAVTIQNLLPEINNTLERFAAVNETSLEDSIGSLLEQIVQGNSKLENIITNQHATLTSVKNECLDLNSSLEKLQHTIDTHKSMVDQQAITINHLSNEKQILEQQLVQMEYLLKKRDNDLQQLKQILNEVRERAKSDIGRLKQEIERIKKSKDEVIQSILNSKSWQLTEPLRKITEVLHHPKASIEGIKKVKTRMPVEQNSTPSPEPKNATEKRHTMDTESDTTKHSFTVTEAAESTEQKLPSINNQNRLTANLSLFLKNPLSQLIFPYTTTPVVSIIIPTYNRAEFLFECIYQLIVTIDIPAELIIVDDASEDATRDLLLKTKNVISIINDKNLNFIRSCNKGAQSAKGKYILFLNNDIVVDKNAISELVRTAELDEKTAVVGAQITRFDGSLQEAGSIIWKDGSASGYGRGENPLKPEYQFVRQVDYCSGACFLVRRELFEQVGGFDERYVPAYYEESDLCMTFRQMGYNIIYQPSAKVTHHEFGTNTAGKAVELMRINQAKFRKKWHHVLPQQCAPFDFLSARDVRKRKRILLLDDRIPAPELGSGFARSFDILQYLNESNYFITFLPLNAGARTAYQPVTGELQQMGVEVFYGGAFNPIEIMRSRSGWYDYVFVSRPHNAQQYFPLIRECFPKAKLIYDAEALFYERTLRHSEIQGDRLTDKELSDLKRKEFSVINEADTVIVVSEKDKNTILDETEKEEICVVGTVHTPQRDSPPFEARSNILFIGGFIGKNPPNTDAITYFVKECWGIVRAQLPNCKLLIAGAAPHEQILNLQSDSVEVLGFVEDLEQLYNQCRVFIVPMRFCAGIPVKLTHAMSHGIPSVVTHISVKGLAVRHQEEILIAGNSEDFANAVIRLYQDRELWYHIQKMGYEFIETHCNSQLMKKNLARAFK